MVFTTNHDSRRLQRLDGTMALQRSYRQEVVTMRAPRPCPPTPHICSPTRRWGKGGSGAQGCGWRRQGDGGGAVRIEEGTRAMCRGEEEKGDDGERQQRCHGQGEPEWYASRKETLSHSRICATVSARIFPRWGLSFSKC